MISVPRWAQHVLAVGVLLAAAALTYLPAFGFPPVIPPFNLDNISAFHVGAQSDPASFFTDPGDYYFRPLAYLSLWAQYQLDGLRPSFFFSVNLALWIACALCAYALVARHTASALAAGAAALALLLDNRATTALIWIIERQSTLVCLFGGLALLLAYRLPRAGVSRGLAVGALALLLLASALSKEYGLAFAAAVGALAIVTLPEQRRALLCAVGISTSAYFVLRWGVGGQPLGVGGSEGFCERMGYFGDTDMICYGKMHFHTRLLQHVWNVGATLIATFLPPLFTGSGQWRVPSFLGLLFPVAVSACAVVAWVKHPRVTAPFLTLVVANTLLSFTIFRSRNQVVGMFGLYVSAGIGFIPALHLLADQARALGRRLPRAPAPALGVAVVVIAFAAGAVTRSNDIRTGIEREADDYATRDPCNQIGNFDPPMGREIPEALRLKFGLYPVECPPAVE